MSKLTELLEYGKFLRGYFATNLGRLFSRFETRKDNLVDTLVRQRGKLVRPFIHSGVMGLVFVGVTLGPMIYTRSPRVGQGEGNDPDVTSGSGLVLGMSAGDPAGTVAQTQISEKPRAEIVDYAIQSGDTVSSIAAKFGVSEDTIYWENNLTPKSMLKPGTRLRILPTSGVKHLVARGETVDSISKKYDASAQAIVDWPFNSFVNDETFELAVGQTLIVPDGVKPDEVQVSPRRFLARETPDAGTVTASGVWAWPAQGRLTQGYAWYHPGIDIGNKSLPAILASDSGAVVAVNSYAYGYGKHILIDHGNGFTTLYAHLSALAVGVGQTVRKGDVIGTMGSTGRSTGPHLHFEIRKNGVSLSPLNLLQ